MDSQWICDICFLFILRAALLHTCPNHDKCFGMLTQCFCITHNSLSPVLPPIWDRLARKQRQSRCTPAAPAHLSPPAGCCKQSSVVSQSMNMRTKGKRHYSDRHFCTTPPLQVWASVCQAGCLFLYIPIPSSPHITHTWWQTRQQCCVCTCDYNLNSKCST